MTHTITLMAESIYILENMSEEESQRPAPKTSNTVQNHVHDMPLQEQTGNEGSLPDTITPVSEYGVEIQGQEAPQVGENHAHNAQIQSVPFEPGGETLVAEEVFRSLTGDLDSLLDTTEMCEEWHKIPDELQIAIDELPNFSDSYEQEHPDLSEVVPIGNQEITNFQQNILKTYPDLDNLLDSIQEQTIESVTQISDRNHSQTVDQYIPFSSNVVSQPPEQNLFDLSGITPDYLQVTGMPPQQYYQQPQMSYEPYPHTATFEQYECMPSTSSQQDVAYQYNPYPQDMSMMEQFPHMAYPTAEPPHMQQSPTLRRLLSPENTGQGGPFCHPPGPSVMPYQFPHAGSRSGSIGFYAAMFLPCRRARPELDDPEYWIYQI